MPSGRHSPVSLPARPCAEPGQAGWPDVKCRNLHALPSAQNRTEATTAAVTSSAARKPTPSRGYLAVIRAIDKFTEVTSYLFVLVIIPLILANVVEVFARYVLRAPTIWALDVTTMSYATLFMLGAALALLKGAHVRTDMLWERFSDRTKGMIDSLAALLLFLPTMAVLFFISIDERSSSGAWTPVIWPLRGVIPLTAFMLFLQGVSELLKSLWAWRTGEFLTKHEKIEV